MPAPNLARAAFSQGSAMIRVRRSTGAYIDGRWVVHGDHDEMIRMAIRPNSFSPSASPFSKRFDEEGGARWWDSITALVMPSTPLRYEQTAENGGISPDRIFFRSTWWKVVGEIAHDENGFRRYIALREPKWGES